MLKKFMEQKIAKKNKKLIKRLSHNVEKRKKKGKIRKRYGSMLSKIKR